MNVVPLKNLKKPFEAYSGDAPYVFVSYAHQDVEIVFIELVRLKKLGFNVWYDEGISPGSRWSDALAERIANCALFLYYVTPRSAASQNCQDEAIYVLDAGNPFLAVHLEETELPPGLKLRMGSRQAILRYELVPGTYHSKLYAAITSQAPELVQRDLTQGFRLGDYKVEPLKGDVIGRDGAMHHLEPKVMDVFVHLSEHAGELVTRHELLEAVWPKQVAADELLTRAISELRRVLHDGRDTKYIETVPKRGYRLIGDVRLPDRVVPQEIAAPAKKIAQPVARDRAFAYLAAGVVAATTLLAFAIILFILPVAPPPPVSGYTQLTKSQVVFPPARSPTPLVVDASRIYFNDWEAGRVGIRQLSQGGGEAAKIASPFDDPNLVVLPLAVTPDESQLLISTFVAGLNGTETLWHWPLVGGNPRRLGHGMSSTYSPDGSRIVYVVHPGPSSFDASEIYLARTDLSDARKLVTAPGRAYWPRISPDGRRVRFTVFESPEDEGTIWGIAADGSDLRQVFPGSGASGVCCGSWTPDGTYYVFQATRDDRTQIWAIREQRNFLGNRRSEAVQITTGALDFRRPTIAPDGTRIFAIGWQLRGEVVRFDKEAGRFLPLPGFESLSAEWLSYSRDEKWVAYVSYPAAELWRSKSDGSNRVQLTFSPMQVMNPAWSPDGQSIAFEGHLPGEDTWHIYIVPAEGGPPRPITDKDEEWPTYGASWSPDGKSLAFGSGGKERIQMLDLATGKISELDGSEGMYAPRWSPDGRYLATKLNGSLNVYDLTTGRFETLHENAPSNWFYWFYWARDGQYIYVHDDLLISDDPWMYRVNIESKAREKVAQIGVGAVRAAEGVFEVWVGVTPDGSPLMLRDLSIHHIYALDWPRD